MRCIRDFLLHQRRRLDFRPGQSQKSWYPLGGPFGELGAGRSSQRVQWHRLHVHVAGLSVLGLRDYLLRSGRDAFSHDTLGLASPSIPCGPVFDAVNECLLAKTASAGVLLAPSSDPTAPTPRDPRASATRLVGCQRLLWLLQASSASWRGLQSQLSGCANCSPQPKVSECKTSRRQWMSRPCSQRTCR